MKSDPKNRVNSTVATKRINFPILVYSYHRALPRWFSTIDIRAGVGGSGAELPGRDVRYLSSIEETERRLGSIEGVSRVVMRWIYNFQEWSKSEFAEMTRQGKARLGANPLYPLIHGSFLTISRRF
jgi:hypothetical protein